LRSGTIVRVYSDGSVIYNSSTGEGTRSIYTSNEGIAFTQKAQWTRPASGRVIKIRKQENSMLAQIIEIFRDGTFTYNSLEGSGEIEVGRYSQVVAFEVDSFDKLTLPMMIQLRAQPWEQPKTFRMNHVLSDGTIIYTIPSKPSFQIGVTTVADISGFVGRCSSYAAEDESQWN
jgi:hypothetical protein